MSRKSFTIEPQRLEPGRGYQPCDNHQAARVVILEVTVVPPKAGRKRYRVTRIHSTYWGKGAYSRAAQELAGLVRRAQSIQAVDRKIVARSLTRAEYDTAVDNGMVQPEVKWKRQPANWRTTPQGRSE